MKSLTVEEAKQYIGTKTLLMFWDRSAYNGFVVSALYGVREHARYSFVANSDAEGYKNCAVYKPKCDCDKAGSQIDALTSKVTELSYLASQFSMLKHGTDKHKSLTKRLSEILHPDYKELQDNED